MNHLIHAFRFFWPKDLKISLSSTPALSRGGVGHDGSKRPDACHTRPARVAKRKAARAARRLNR